MGESSNTDYSHRYTADSTPTMTIYRRTDVDRTSIAGPGLIGMASGLLWSFNEIELKWMVWKTVTKLNIPRLPYWEKVGDVIHEKA